MQAAWSPKIGAANAWAMSCDSKGASRPKEKGETTNRRIAILALTNFVPARIVWTRVCNSGGLFHGGCVTGFMG
jgi:hypothetical protein